MNLLVSKLDEIWIDRTRSLRSSDLRYYFDSFISRDGDAEIGRKPDGWKTQTLNNSSIQELAREDLTISRYGDFKIAAQLTANLINNNECKVLYKSWKSHQHQ